MATGAAGTAPLNVPCEASAAGPPAPVDVPSAADAPSAPPVNVLNVPAAITSPRSAAAPSGFNVPVSTAAASATAATAAAAGDTAPAASGLNVPIHLDTDAVALGLLEWSVGVRIAPQMEQHAANATSIATARHAAAGVHASVLHLSAEQSAARLAQLRDGIVIDALPDEREYNALNAPLRAARSRVIAGCGVVGDVPLPTASSVSVGSVVALDDAAAAFGIGIADMRLAVDAISAAITAAETVATDLTSTYSSAGRDATTIARRLRSLAAQGVDAAPPPQCGREVDYVAMFAPLRALRQLARHTAELKTDSPAAAGAASTSSTLTTTSSSSQRLDFAALTDLETRRTAAALHAQTLPAAATATATAAGASSASLADYGVTVAVVGASADARKALLARFVGRYHDYREPKGVAQTSITQRFGSKTVECSIVDTSSAPKYLPVARMQSRRWHGAMLLLDVGERDGVETARGWARELATYAPPGLPFALIGIRLDDTAPVVITAEEAMALASECRIPYFDAGSITTTSALDNITSTLARDALLFSLGRDGAAAFLAAEAAELRIAAGAAGTPSRCVVS